MKSNQEGPARLILADSNQLVRFGLKAIFVHDQEVEVVAEASDQKELLNVCDDFQPHLILLDFAAVGFSIDTIPHIRKRFPGVRFIAITGEQTALTITSALKAGVVSYIKKDCDIGEIVSAVRETAAGGRFFCGQILEVLRRDDIDPEDRSIAAFTCEPVSLSERELEVITLIAEGHTNVQIAEKLFLSGHTVNTHRKNIMTKLGVNNTASIVMYAVKTQLVSPNRFLFSPQTQ